MEDFAESLPEGRERDALLRALGENRPFRRFNDAVGAMGKTRERWFAFRQKELLEYADAWLINLELDFELVPFARPPVAAILNCMDHTEGTEGTENSSRGELSGPSVPSA